MLKPVPSQRVYEGILRQLQELLVQGVLKPGDRLPSEREIMEQMRVSRSSVREAFSVLETLGVVESRQGDGKVIRAAGLDPLVTALAFTLSAESNRGIHVLEVRTMLEVEAAALAASRASEEGMLLLTRAMDAMVEGRGALGDQEDIQFHFAIASATGNPVLVTTMNAISDLFAISLRASRIQLYQQSGAFETLLAQHRAIYNAIVERNPDEASTHMRQHLLYVREELLTLNQTDKP